MRIKSEPVAPMLMWYISSLTGYITRILVKLVWKEVPTVLVYVLTYRKWAYKLIYRLYGLMESAVIRQNHMAIQ